MAVTSLPVSIQDVDSADVVVVLVHWNQARALERTIDRFRDQDANVCFVVVDNASRPDEIEHVRKIVADAPDIELIEAVDNLGFGPGANAGLRWWLEHTTTTWAIVAPHDAAPGEGCVRALIDACERRPLAGLACADVGDGHVPFIDPYFGGLTRPARQTTGWEPADYTHGTLMMLGRTCVEEIGLFDERYFSYNEEADLGRRARQAGWEVGLVHEATVTNTHLGTSVAAVDYLQQRNTLLMVREMSGRYHAFIRLCISLGHIVSGLVSPSKRPLIFDAVARLAGIRDFLRGRYGPPPAAMYLRP